MIFALLTILIIGLALYETGYGVTNTLFRSLRKQIIVQLTAAAAFFTTAFIVLPEAIASPAANAINLGFLGMIAYTATATIKDCRLVATASAIVGGLLFPVILYLTNTYLNTIQYVDLAGAGLVHFVGGVVALIASLYTSRVIGSRPGIVVRPYSATLGFLVLWAGWITYVGIISLPVLQSSTEMWVRGMVNMSTATAWGAVAAVAYMWTICGKVKMRTCTVGGLAGMVAMSADPFSSPFWGAIIIGAAGGIAAVITYGLLCKYKTVDQSNAISIHMIPGAFGVLITPLFNASAELGSQMMGLTVLMVVASSMGVVVCELHNLSKPNNLPHS